MIAARLSFVLLPWQPINLEPLFQALLPSRFIAYSIPAILTVAANVLLIHENLTIRASLTANAKAVAEWNIELSEAKEAKRKASEA